MDFNLAESKNLRNSNKAKTSEVNLKNQEGYPNLELKKNEKRNFLIYSIHSFRNMTKLLK